MAVEWSDDLLTGIDEIDDQHRELFQKINKLLEACRRHEGKLEVGQTLRFLEEYAQEHFYLEETSMKEYDYPGLTEHALRHREFINNFVKLHSEFHKHGPSLSVVIEANQMMAQWLCDHIRTVDQEMAGFLRDKVS